MSTKFPLTSDGVRKKQDELFNLKDEDLRKAVITISQDLRKYIYDNFELKDEQKKLYESLPKDYNLTLGWQVCSALILRKHVSFETNSEKAQSRPPKGGGGGGGVDVTTEIKASYNPKTGGQVSAGVKIHCKL